MYGKCSVKSANVIVALYIVALCSYYWPFYT